MRNLLSIVCLSSVTPAFAAASATGVNSSLQPFWIQLLMLFAMLLVGITSRQISRVR
jgi:hypothetical protein